MNDHRPSGDITSTRMLWSKHLVVLLCFLTFGNCQAATKFIYGVDGIAEPEIVQQKWGLLESRTKSLLREAFKMLMGASFSNESISSTCMRDGFRVIVGLKSMELWAFKFLDATSKSIDGLLDGSGASLGNYDECVNNKIVSKRADKHKGEILFTGKYCRLNAMPYIPPKRKHGFNYKKIDIDALKNFSSKNTMIGEAARNAFAFYGRPVTTGLCVPSSCSEEDINQMLEKASEYMGVVIKVSRCEVKEEANFGRTTIAVIALYSFTGSLVLIGTLLDVFCYYKKRSFKSTTSIRILMAFSFMTNSKKLTDTSSSAGNFSCFHGMKVLTMFWIILGHTYAFLTFYAHKQPSFFAMRGYFVLQPLVNASISVITFFFISGVLVCYNFIKLVKFQKKPFSLMMYLLHRLWRILPTYAYSVAFMFLLPLLVSGPISNDIVHPLTHSCYKNWWATLTFVNNFYDSGHVCLPHGWYLAVEMQLYIGALIVLIPLARWPKFGISITVVIIFASMIGSWLSVYMNGLGPTLAVSYDPEYFPDMARYYYFLPHVHLGPYCIGILCGYVLAVYPKFKIPMVVQVFGWCAAIAACVSVTNGGQKWHNGIEPTFLETLFYSSCNRVAWTLGIAWVLICCATGHGGIVNYILSWKVWIPLGRLTYVAYLANPLVVLLYIAGAKTEILFDNRSAIWNFFGHVIVSYLISFGGNMLVEAPFMSLEKILITADKKKVFPNDNKEANDIVDDPAIPKLNYLTSVLSINDKLPEANDNGNVKFVHKL